MSSNRYLELSRLDCSDGIEVKHGGLKYLKWSVAWHKLASKYPESTYYFGEPLTLPDGTMMVKAGVTVEGLTHEMHLPVLDHRNKPISGPNAFDFNTAQMRCLVKATAMHGIGIELYHGETNITGMSQFEKAQELINDGEPVLFHEFVHNLGEEEVKEVFNGAPAGTKTAFKTQWREELKKAETLLAQYTAAVQEAIAAGDELGLAEMRAELTKYEMKIVAGRLSAEEKQKAAELKELANDE